MSTSNLDAFHLDRSVVSVRALTEAPDDLGYWQGQPPERRLQAIEYLRETFHGHAYSLWRIEKVAVVAIRQRKS